MSTVPSLPGTPIASRAAFPFLAPVPWLMLASAIRFVGWFFGPAGFLFLAASDLAVFMAFLLAAHGMIEWTGGRTRIGRMPFRDQIALGWQILKRVFGLLLAVVVIAGFVFGRGAVPPLLLGVDGIAFDQAGWIGMVWSAVLAALILLMLVQIGEGSGPALFPALAEFTRRAAYLLPAIAVGTILLVVLSAVQGWVRVPMAAMMHVPEIPRVLSHLVYFAFVFGFATLRIWIIVTILVHALRASYRQVGPAGAMVKAD